jgi:hypothetical protein
VSEPSRRWDIVVKIGVDAASEAQARSIADMLLRKMQVTPDRTPVTVRFDDGSWATEIHVDTAGFEHVEPNDPLSVLSSLTADLGPATWVNRTDTPFDPDSAREAVKEWPPGYWTLAGRKETLVHPSVRAVLLRASRR